MPITPKDEKQLKRKAVRRDTERFEKIKKKMREDYARPLFVYRLFEAQSDAKYFLSNTNAEINKSINRGGTTKGFHIIKDPALMNEVRALAKKLDNYFLSQKISD